MQLRPRNKLVSIPNDNIYRDTRGKGTRPTSWSWARKAKRAPGSVVLMTIEDYRRTNATE